MLLMARQNAPGAGRLGMIPLRKRQFPHLPPDGAILVASLQEKLSDEREKPQQEYDLCLFILHESPGFASNQAIADVVENLFEEGQLFHTIGHERCQENSSWGIRWNLPCSYRSCTKRQRKEIENWVRELDGQPPVGVSIRKRVDVSLAQYANVVILFAETGTTYEMAANLVKEFRDERRQLLPEIESSDGQPQNTGRLRRIDLDEFVAHVGFDSQ